MDDDVKDKIANWMVENNIGHLTLVAFTDSDGNVAFSYATQTEKEIVEYGYLNNKGFTC